MAKWTVYTDGSCSPNPGPGGAGAVVLRDGNSTAELIYAGGCTTNNKMELFAIIMSFDHIPKDAPVTVYTDSQYVQKGLTAWSPNWIRRGWKTAGGRPVKNAELWRELVALQKQYPLVTVKWIKAHQDKLPVAERTEDWEWNDVADSLANEGTTLSKLDTE